MPLLNSVRVPQLTDEVLKILKSARVVSVEDLFLRETMSIFKHVSLCDSSGNLTPQLLEDIKSILREKYAVEGFSGYELHIHSLRNSDSIESTAQNLNNLLNGGIPCGEVTEFVGETKAGKSQICMSLTLSVCLRNKDDGCLYIDSSNSFTPARIVEMIENTVPGSGAELIERLLNRILCARIHDIFGVLTKLRAVYQALKDMEEDDKETPYGNIKLIVVDSVGALISSVLGGLNSPGHSLMMHLALLIKKLSLDFNIAVVTTNHTVGNGTWSKAALGESWKSVPTNRILVDTDGATSGRFLTLIKSPRNERMTRLPFVVNQWGIR